MMRFSLTYRKAIDIITADKTLKLRKYELDNDDWLIVEDLVAVLEVRFYLLYTVCTTNNCKYIDLQKGDPLLLSRHGQCCSRDTCHGQAQQPLEPQCEEALPSGNQVSNEARSQKNKSVLLNDRPFVNVSHCNG
jgi:hypothetical protein